jgi:hypothetical protein
MEMSKSERNLEQVVILDQPNTIPLTLQGMAGSKWGYLTQLKLLAAGPKGWKNLSRADMPVIR